LTIGPGKLPLKAVIVLDGRLRTVPAGKVLVHAGLVDVSGNSC